MSTSGCWRKARARGVPLGCAQKGLAALSCCVRISAKAGARSLKGSTMGDRIFRDRRHAGQLLARRLAGFAYRAGAMVLALPRGGVPVAFEVAQALRAPLDVFL